MPQIFKRCNVYQALYRKYRPLVFEDVVGQEHVVGTVKNQIINNKVSHAYMFTGTRGTGKTTCAKILARAVNCENPINGNPCNECATCKGILNGSLLDVFEIDAASNNGVDNIRELREDVIFTPASAKYKVYIIDEVHMLSIQAFNALLKTLEEPPAHIIFVFATTEINKVPQTILSRCQRFDFKRITQSDVSKRLDYVAKQEGFTLENDASVLIAKLSDGAMRDALSILDRCVNGNETVSLDIVEKTVGICSYDEISVALNAISENDVDSVLNFYSECRRNSKDAVSLFSEICTYLRDILVIKLTKSPLDLLGYDQEKYNKIKELSDKFSNDQILRSISVLQNGIYDINRFKDKHLMAEMTLIKLTSNSIGTDIDSVIARLTALEQNGVTQRTVPVSKPTNSAVTPSVVKKTVSTVSQSNADFWQSMLDDLSANGGRSLAVLLKSISSQVDGSVLKFKCDKNDFSYSVISQAANIELIKKAIKNVTGQDYSVTFIDKETKNISSDDVLSELLNNADEILYEE